MALSGKVLLPDSSGVDIVELDDKPRDFSVKIRQLVIKCLYQRIFIVSRKVQMLHIMFRLGTHM